MSEIRRFIVTGGPGAGKTTLLNGLAARGFRTFPEAGRAIIRAHGAVSGPAGHTADRVLFAELMLSWDMRSWQEAANGLSFFDRGVPELLGYLRLCGLVGDVPKDVELARGGVARLEPVGSGC